MNNVSVKFVDMPCSIRGCIVRHYDDDEYFTIMINSRMSADAQASTYKHEIEHLNCNDFSCYLSAGQIESIRHD